MTDKNWDQKVIKLIDCERQTLGFAVVKMSEFLSASVLIWEDRVFLYDCDDGCYHEVRAFPIPKKCVYQKDPAQLLAAINERRS